MGIIKIKKMIQILFLLAGIFLLGWIIIDAFQFHSKIEKIAVSVLVGVLLSTYATFFLFTFSPIQFSRIFLIIFFAATVLLLLFISKIKNGSFLLPFFELKSIFTFKALNKIDWSILFILFFIVSNVIISNFYWPIVDWDSLALYDFRAKVLAHEGTFDRGIELGYFFHYTPFTSILHAYNYIMGIAQAKMWYSVLFCAYLLIFYYFLRIKTSRTIALVGVFLLATTGTLLAHAKMAYTNLPYTIYLTSGLFYLLLWWESGRKKDIILGTLFVAGSTWIRSSEPFWLFATAIIAFGIFLKYKKDWLLGFISIAVLFFFKYPWMYYISSLHHSDIPSVISLTGASQLTQKITPSTLLSRATEVAHFLYQIFRGMIEIYALPIILSLISVVASRSWHKLKYFILLAFLILGIFFGTIYFSFQFPEWQSIPDSALRMSMFLFPIVIFIIMISEFWNIRPKKKNSSYFQEKKQKT